MNNTQEKKQVVGEYDFLEDVKNLHAKNFNDYDFKNDYVLSVRLSYDDEKKQTQIFKDYVRFLKDDLKVINEKNDILVKSEKVGQYFYIVEKTIKFNDYFNKLSKFIKTLDSKENSMQLQILTNLLNCKNDLNDNNFTISNFKEKKDKILYFINYCKNKNLVK